MSSDGPVVLSVFVPGVPKPKGSLDVVSVRHVREAVAGSKDWRKVMADQLRAAWGGRAPDERAMVVRAVFLMPTNSVIVRGPGSGDIDKLTRNLLDALQDAGVYRDDVQVVRLRVDKRVADVGTAPGVAVGVAVMPW